jgi:acetyl esterase/lipase
MFRRVAVASAAVVVMGASFAVGVTPAVAAVAPIGLTGTVSCGDPVSGTGTVAPPFTMSPGSGARTTKSTVTFGCTGTGYTASIAPIAAKIVTTALNPDASQTCTGLLSPAELPTVTKATVTWTLPGGVKAKPTHVVYSTIQTAMPSMGSTTPGPTGTVKVTGSYVGERAVASLVVSDTLSTLTTACQNGGISTFHFGSGSTFTISEAGIPASGLYSSAQYAPSTFRQYPGILYTSAVDATGTLVPLHLDVTTPPATAPKRRPSVVLIHGGAFVGGSRSDMVGVAQAWVARGYNTVSIDYRLDQSLYQDSSPPKQAAAAAAATADAEVAVRWMKANAAKYGIDPNRIAAVGYSAGGAIALGMSAAPDGDRTGPYTTYSSKIAGAVSTGAYLTPGIDLGLLTITGGLAPILMFHYETDVASNTGAYAFETCAAYRAAGSSCEYVSQAGEGHTTDLTPGSVWWSNEVGPFVWRTLRLG